MVLVFFFSRLKKKMVCFKFVIQKQCPTSVVKCHLVWIVVVKSISKSPFHWEFNGFYIHISHCYDLKPLSISPNVDSTFFCLLRAHTHIQKREKTAGENAKSIEKTIAATCFVGRIDFNSEYKNIDHVY